MGNVNSSSGGSRACEPHARMTPEGRWQPACAADDCLSGNPGLPIAPDPDLALDIAKALLAPVGDIVPHARSEVRGVRRLHEVPVGTRAHSSESRSSVG